MSIATDDFKIVKECLLSNYEYVYKLLNKTYPKSFGAREIRDWPLFIDFRDTKFYSDFVEKYKEDFQVFEIDKENITS